MVFAADEKGCLSARKIGETPLTNENVNIDEVMMNSSFGSGYLLLNALLIAIILLGLITTLNHSVY